MKQFKMICCASIVLVAPAMGQGIKRLTATAKLTDPATGKELQVLKMGNTVNYLVSASNLDAVANKRTTIAYTLSVVPSGSPQPIVLSGRLALTATLAGGIAETKQQAAQYAGTKDWSGSLVVPDYLPEGSATLTMSLMAPGGGAVNITKRFKIVSE